jgi:hypothetical protein
MTVKPVNIYDVHSPWAEADPVSFRGISPRLDSLDGKKIGLFRNSKRAASPALQAVGKKLKEKFPGVELSEFANLKANEIVTEHNSNEEFGKWLNGVDAVITAYGD